MNSLEEFEEDMLLGALEVLGPRFRDIAMYFEERGHRYLENYVRRKLLEEDERVTRAVRSYNSRCLKAQLNQHLLFPSMAVAFSQEDIVQHQLLFVDAKKKQENAPATSLAVAADDEVPSPSRKRHRSKSGGRADEEEGGGTARRRSRRAAAAGDDASDDSSVRLVDEEQEEQLCSVCRTDMRESSLMLCDGLEKCPFSYHLTCLEPPLAMIPQGKWTCPRCTLAAFFELAGVELKRRRGPEDDSEDGTDDEAVTALGRSLRAAYDAMPSRTREHPPQEALTLLPEETIDMATAEGNVQSDLLYPVTCLPQASYRNVGAIPAMVLGSIQNGSPGGPARKRRRTDPPTSPPRTPPRPAAKASRRSPQRNTPRGQKR